MADYSDFQEKRIRKITNMYYSRPDVQKEMFEFSKNREISPRYFQGFGKRPDCFQYPGDVFEMVKKGATSFHCSEELWEDPLAVETGMSGEELDEIRIGWDLLMDIDSKYIDYSKIMAQLIIKILEFHGIKNIGVKFSGSKGFHLIVPWKAFPKVINGVDTSKKFPEYPRIVTKYINEKIKNQLIERISNLEKPSKYVKDFTAPQEVMPDLVLVSSRHLFRMPYSLHEKTALASVVLTKQELDSFQLKDADPLKAKVRKFMPDCKEGEASELLMQALDWHRENEIKTGNKNDKKIKSKYADFKPISLDNIQEQQFPPCVKKILGGISDGKKRAVFILINLFRSIGLPLEEVEKRIYEWNEKNKPPLKKGYIQAQLTSSYKKKPFMPPNCKEYYQGIGVCQPDNMCKSIKNPVNYVVKRNFIQNKNKNKKQGKKIE
ncbi:hypothetical protein GF378_00585 [Candidatus Pacearchaeota archaeon]|nr:hypothetical protein [Candidatus Pacearchaeota archaeon]